MPQIQITCDTPGSSIYYTLDGSVPDSSKNLYSNVFGADVNTTVKAIGIKEGYDSSDIAEFEVNIKIGTEIVKDGITGICVYDAGSEQDWGRWVFVDKSHDLSYYIRGVDNVNAESTSDASTTPYPEWGGYGTSTSITSQDIGDGLSNTNSLIDLNLQPNTSGWPVLWDWVEQFRSSHSNDWFVPSLQELSQVYSQRNYLENLSLSTNPYYWTSSEDSSNYAYDFSFSNGDLISNNKNRHYIRSRLCFYL